MADGTAPGSIATVWPPDYVKEFGKRQRRLLRNREKPELWVGARVYYRDNPHDFIEHWCVTVDPRNAGFDGKLTTMPFILFQRQRELVDFIVACLNEEAHGLTEKCRDMGATWVCVAISVWLWCFWDGVAIGWGSRKEDLVDKIGDASSIFEKIKITIRELPRELLPPGFNIDKDMSFMRVINGLGGGSIIGEVGDDIGRGGRTRVYFKDESGHYQHPEMIEAALGENTRVQFDISSVNGLGNVFQRTRESGIDWVPGAKPIKGKANVFVMDWRDHPEKDNAWHEMKRQEYGDKGLLHVFEQEINRNYAASIQGTIIPGEWIRSAINAHLISEFEGAGWEDGPWGGSLDVADSLEGSVGDRNAGAFRKGVVLREIYEWGELDTGKTARRMVAMCREKGAVVVQYDCIGIGSGVKAETNRLDEEGLMPPGVRWVPWDAGLAALDPEAHVIEGDKDSPKNKDFFGNLKAQGWWSLRMRFERTHRCVQAGALLYPVDDLISIDSRIPLLRQIEKELAQPTRGEGGRMRMIVNKTPKGTRSPNLGDAIMMGFWPIPQRAAVVVSAEAMRRFSMPARRRL